MKRISFLSVWMLAGLVGCELSKNFMEPDGPPPVDLAQIHTIWENHVVTTQDVVNNGAPLIGVAGRLFLFGPDLARPQKATGSLTVDLYNITPGTEPKMLERWEIDKDTLRRLGKEDAIGWGYTIFLPWATYRPDITKVQMQARFVPEKGIPLFSPPAPVSLHQEGPPSITAFKPPQP